MTDNDNPTSPEPATPAADGTATDTAGNPATANKAFWAGVGIGSAALVAALLYARRPKKKK